MHASTKVLLAAVLASSVGCGGRSGAPPVSMNVAKRPAPAAPLARARWVFSRPERGLRAKLDLGAETLYVGDYGRRALGKRDEPLVDATTLALEHLVGALREGEGDFAFVAEDGD